MNLQLLEFKDVREVAAELKSLKVHRGGIAIMSSKAVAMAIKVSGIDSVALNILKQEMLSVGGDCAVSWGTFIKRSKNAEGIIIGTLSQIERLCEKLKKQPLGLPEVAEGIRLIGRNCAKRDYVLKAGKHKLNLGRRAHIMGVLNITPDSFSDGGCYYDRDQAVARALEIEEEGADMIDIGGESTRPGAKSVSAEEECRRVIPVIKILVKRLKIPVSVDTSKPEVAKKALDCGAAIINDITGLKDGRMARLAAKHKAAVVVMHMKGNPRTMQKKPEYKSLIYEITESLRRSVDNAKDAGIADNRIVVDPGIGFGKTAGHNLAILKRLREFKALGYPILVGPSRKSFIGKVLGDRTDDRLFGTAASVAVAICNGADIVRVHDVRQMRQTVRLTEAILNVRP